MFDWLFSLFKTDMQVPKVKPIPVDAYRKHRLPHGWEENITYVRQQLKVTRPDGAEQDDVWFYDNGTVALGATAYKCICMSNNGRDVRVDLISIGPEFGKSVAILFKNVIPQDKS